MHGLKYRIFIKVHINGICFRVKDLNFRFVRTLTNIHSQWIKVMNRKTFLALDHRITFTTGLTVLSANIQHILNTNIWPSARTVARFMTLDHYEWLQWFNYYWLSFELVIWSSLPRIDPCVREVVLCVWIRNQGSLRSATPYMWP